MKLLPGFLLLLASLAFAQTPAGPALPVAGETQKWIASLDATWQEIYGREVTTAFETELAKLRQQYTAAAEANIAAQAKAGNLDQTLVWQAERDRFAAEMNVPAEDAATAPAALKQLRGYWRTQSARLEKERAEHAKAVAGRYDQVLAQAQRQLTQQARIDDALLLKKQREDVATRWLAARPGPAVAETTKPPAPVPVTPAAGLAPEAGEIIVEALIDGRTEFHVRADSVWWETAGGVSRPGKWNGQDEPTYLNDTVWNPQWMPSKKGPDKSAPYTIALRTTDLEFELLAVSAQRGGPGIKRTPPTAGVEATDFVVHIPDPERGACWYKFAVRKKK